MLPYLCLVVIFAGIMINWQPRQVTTDGYRKKNLLPHEVTDHPLKPLTVTVKHRSGSKSSANGSTENSKKEAKKVKASTSWGGVDPLSAALQDFDGSKHDSVPVLNPLATDGAVKRSDKSSDDDFVDDSFENWSTFKGAILKEYTTSEKLSIKTSFLSGGDASGVVVASLRNLQSTSLAEKVKHRLQQLDDFEDGSVKEMFNLSQADYVHRIEDLSVALQSSWETDQRVKALKIAIQCAKLLVDVSVLPFYPSKFVLITDMLDSFGNLVYKRIHCKAETPLALESAIETCRNWFYKIASIRELVPRFYVETAILKTLSFIVDPKLVYSENCKALFRLTAMARGIGDPLVSLYSRAYLCRIIMRIAPMEKTVFRQNLTEFLMISNQLTSEFVIVTLKAQKINFATYLTLFTPALNWILQCIAFKASDSLLEEILDEFQENLQSKGNLPINALLLNSMITTFQPRFIIERAKRFVDLIKECLTTNEDKGFPGYLLLKNLGSSFVEGRTAWINIEKAHKLLLMNEIWKKVSKLKASQHIICADIWMDFVVQYLGVFEVNVLLKDIVKHMQPDRAYEDHYDKLISIVKKVTQFSSLEDYTSFFAMDSFIPFLDMLQKESVKVQACQLITSCYIEKIKSANSTILNSASDDEEELFKISDPVILNSLTYLCKTMHDSVNALTLEDDRRDISNLIIDFLSLVSFHRDFQGYLSFMVEARSNYSHLESVVAFLVTCVNRIIMETRNIVKGQHTKKTTAFVRACLAYSFITIPSLEDPIIRLQLYLNSAQIGLVNGCLPQTDAFLEAAIDLIPSANVKIELSDGQVRLMEPFIVSYVANLLSFLVIVPVCILSSLVF